MAETTGHSAKRARAGKSKGRNGAEVDIEGPEGRQARPGRGGMALTSHTPTLDTSMPPTQDGR